MTMIRSGNIETATETLTELIIIASQNNERIIITDEAGQIHSW